MFHEYQRQKPSPDQTQDGPEKRGDNLQEKDITGPAQQSQKNI
jgi:hypothetical protein